MEEMYLMNISVILTMFNHNQSKCLWSSSDAMAEVEKSGAVVAALTR